MKNKIGEALKSGLIGGVICGIIQGLLGYTILPFPKSLMDHAIGNSIGGFFSGLFAGCIGVLMYIWFHTIKKAQMIMIRLNIEGEL